MFLIDLKSRKAIYEQIVDNFKRLIITGVLPPESKMPSVRELAAQLTVNPNTVQKAYRALEIQGYCYTVLGQGNFVAEAPSQPSPEVTALYDGLTHGVQELLFRGEAAGNIITHVSEATGKTSGGTSLQGLAPAQITQIEVEAKQDGTH